MRQTKLESLIETCVNTLIGFGVSWTAWPVAAWYLEIPLDHGQQFNVTAFFTVLSVARGYVVRRWFDRNLKLISKRIALWFKSL